MLPNSKLLGAALLFAAFGSEALTLGRIRGAALIGQPLDMTVQVQMDAGDDSDARCFDADVFHADTKQDASQIRLAVEATAQAQVVSIRIKSSAVVDEPVVTIYLRTGCGQNTTRRYVLLADIPSEVAAPVMPLITPVPTIATSTQKKALQPLPGGDSAAPSAVPVRALQVKTAPAPKRIVRQPVKAAATPDKSMIADDKLKTLRTGGQPRLILDSLEVLSERVKTLETAAPAALSEGPARDMAKMQSLEGDVKALLALAAKNEASLADLQARLQKAESERFPVAVIFGLMVVLIAFLSGLALFWRRQPSGQATPGRWSMGEAPAMPGVHQNPEQERAPTRPTEHQTLKTADLSTRHSDLEIPHPALAIDVNHVEMSEWRFNKLKQSGTEKTVNATEAAPRDSSHSQPKTQREHDE